MIIFVDNVVEAYTSGLNVGHVFNSDASFAGTVVQCAVFGVFLDV